MPRYFQPEEYACKCGRPECDAPKLLHGDLGFLLDGIRESVGQPLTLTSGLRCRWLNDKLGAAVHDSEHLTGEGADIAIPDSRTRWLVLRALGQLGAKRYGIGASFIHVGVSIAHDGRVAWTYYAKEA